MKNWQWACMLSAFSSFCIKERNWQRERESTCCTHCLFLMALEMDLGTTHSSQSCYYLGLEWAQFKCTFNSQLTSFASTFLQAVSSQACLFLTTKKSSLLQLFALRMKTKPSGLFSLECDMHHACTTNSYNSILLSTPQKKHKKKGNFFSLLRLIFVPSSIRDTSDIWIKLMKTLPILWKLKHPSGRGKEQTEREDQHPAKRTSLKSANTRTKAEINPFALKFNKLELVQLPRAKLCAHFQQELIYNPWQVFFSSLFFWFNFVMYPNWWSTRTLAKFGYRPDMEVEKIMNPFILATCWNLL